MTEEKFLDLLDFLEIPEGDRRALMLHLLFVMNATRSETAAAVGMTPANLSTFVDRVRRKVSKAERLIGGSFPLEIRRGVTGRKVAK